MLDIKLIREQAQSVRERLESRAPGTGDLVLEVVALDEARRKAIAEVERLKAERNAMNKEIGGRKAKGESADDLLAGMKEKSQRVAELDKEAAEIDAKRDALLLMMPNVPHENCPVGADASANPVVCEWGEKPVFACKPKDHVALCDGLGLLDFEAAAKISGAGFSLYRGEGARLQRALIQFLLDLHTRENGYLEISPPFVVRESAMRGTGQFPKFRDQVYSCPEDGLFLVPTAEVPVTNIHAEEILKPEQLPIRYVAYTPCFRREAGSAGTETRGLTRMHQFDKVELVKIVHPDRSFEELESLRCDAEGVLERLGLHYRTIELCTGDLGFGAAKCYDLEVWAPGAGTYLEVSSCSNFCDFQARRMNTRFKDEEGKNRFVHTLNGSGTALARLFIALVETYQREDGTVRLPDVLHPYFGKDIVSFSPKKV